MTKAGYSVHVISDCVTSYDLKKIDEMLKYYESKGCEVKTLAEYIEGVFGHHQTGDARRPSDALLQQGVRR